MKILTKFLNSSVAVSLLIVSLLGGSNLLLHRAERSTDEKHSKIRQTLETTLLLESTLNNQLGALKNFLLMDRNPTELRKYEQAKSSFLSHLNAVEGLLYESEDIAFLRHRHQTLSALAARLSSNSAPTRHIHQDMRALNSFSKDIQFYLDMLLSNKRQQEALSHQQLKRLIWLRRMLDLAIIGVLLLVFFGQFRWILLPIVRSIEQFQQGTARIGAGDLGYRLEIKTGDEIEALSHEFNQMTAKLEVSAQMLEQRLADLQDAKEAAEAANQSKSSFLANMNHELRTPLNGILGYAQILARHPETTPKQQRGVEVIRRCGTHLLTLINDILDLSKAEVGRMELYPQDFHLPNFLIATVEICQVKAKQKGLAFHYHASDRLPTAVFADDKRLRQVLLNLLSNAIKFTHSGSVTFNVALAGDCVWGADDRHNPPCPVNPVRAASPQEKPAPVPKIRFQVEDTGIGIAPEQLTGIFLPFEQINGRDRNSEGTGLGLAISQQMVQMMESEIQVQSTLGQGSRFWFEVALPVASEWIETKEKQATSRILGYQGKRRKILVVDDRAENRSVIVNMLEPMDFKVIEASNGEDGFDRAVMAQPDLIITDVVMSSMNGLEMTRQLRQLPEFKTLPIIASPASLSRVERQESLNAGCTEFMPKPVDFEELLGHLQKHLKLQWIFEHQENPTQIFPDAMPLSVELVAPPPEELAALHDSARGGFIREIQQKANRLKQLDPKYIPFANRLLELAQEFETVEILNLVEKSIAQETADAL